MAFPSSVLVTANGQEIGKIYFNCCNCLGGDVAPSNDVFPFSISMSCTTACCNGCGENHATLKFHNGAVGEVSRSADCQGRPVHDAPLLVSGVLTKLVEIGLFQIILPPVPLSRNTKIMVIAAAIWFDFVKRGPGWLFYIVYITLIFVIMILVITQAYN